MFLAASSARRTPLALRSDPVGRPRERKHRRAALAVACAAACLAAARPLPAQRPLTLDSAIAEAEASNARLPVAALGVRLAQTDVRESLASRYPALAIEGFANFGGPRDYTTSQGQLQLVGTETLYSGGLRHATLTAARHRAEAASAGYRLAQKDVDLNVRLQFVQFLRAESEITLREQGIARLQSYLAIIQGRKAAGMPVENDILTTRVRLGSEQATLADARRTLDEARLMLNDLLGREPAAPLVLDTLAAPQPPGAAPGTPWLAGPEVRQAQAASAAAQAGIAAARAERKPQLTVSANAGAQPVFAATNFGTGPNAGSGLGAAIVFGLTWPIFDFGGYRARLERAQVDAEQAQSAQAVVERSSRLQWELASAQLTRLYDQVQAWARNVPLARDAYLQMESTYSGGAATTVEVLDAYTAWIAANDSYADAVLRYRQAEAALLRWGTP